MKFTKSRIEKCRELVDKGYLDAAAMKLESYLEEGLQEQSDVAKLLERASKLDETIRGAMVALQQEYAEDAKKKLSQVDTILQEIKVLATAIGQEEKKLEK